MNIPGSPCKFISVCNLWFMVSKDGLGSSILVTHPDSTKWHLTSKSDKVGPWQRRTERLKWLQSFKGPCHWSYFIWFNIYWLTDILSLTLISSTFSQTFFIPWFSFLYHWSDVVFIVHCLLILVFCFSLSSTRLQDNGVASSSSVDSLSCLQSGFKSRQNNRCRSSETSGSTTFKKQFDKVKSQSKLVNSSKIYCVDSQVQKMW